VEAARHRYYTEGRVARAQALSAAIEIERLETDAANLRRVLAALITELDSTALIATLWPELRRLADEARGVVGR